MTTIRMCPQKQTFADFDPSGIHKPCHEKTNNVVSEQVQLKPSP